MIQSSPFWLSLVLLASSWTVGGSAQSLNCPSIFAQLAGEQDEEFALKKVFVLPDGRPFSRESWIEWFQKPNQDVYSKGIHLTNLFAQRAAQLVARSQAPAEAKVAAYEKFAQAIQQSVQEMQEEVRNHPRTPHPEAVLPSWEARKRTIGGGITLFYGRFGQILEIHPDGSVYRVDAKLEIPIDAFHPSWKAPYDERGRRKNFGILGEARKIE